MKRFLIAFATILLFAGCTSQYDDSALITRIESLETRVTTLESNVDALQSALGEGKFVLKVEEYADPVTGKTVGITVTYTTGEVKHFSIQAANDYTAPVLSVMKNGAGELCWAVDGVIVNVGGKDVTVYQTPVFSIDDDGFLWVEIDGKKVKLGSVQNEGATLQDGIFTDLKVTDTAVVLTLSDNSTVNIPFAEAFKLNIATTEYVYSTPAPIEIPYTVSAKTTSTVVDVWYPKDFSVKVEADKIIVTPLTAKASGQLLAYADSKVGLTSIVKITVEAEGIEVIDTPVSETVDYVAQGNGGEVVANVVSNIEFDVKPVDDWITVASVKSTVYVITLTVAENTTGAYREGKVNIVKKGTEDVIQTITIAQDKASVVAKDLSEKGGSNCYIVTAAGDYKFVPVKGNSAELVGTIAKAELLWETCNNAEDVAANSVIASVGYSGGYMTFSTPATLKHGNALIAAKDAEGKILWSWHIWIPKTAPAAELYGLSESKKMMDRNIGALDAPAVNSDDAQNAGLFYQWGRKDPLRAVSSIAEGTKAKTYPADVWTESSTQLTAANMHETPCVFIKGSEDWIDVSDKTLWSDAKTVNDPCPLGYKVPKRNETGLFDYLTPDETYLGWAVNNDKNYYTVGKEATSYAVFPFGHYTRSGSYDLKGDGRSWIWTATQKSDTEATQARTIVLNTTTDKLDCSGQKKANGVYVRCVVDSAEPVLPPQPDPGEPGGPSGPVAAVDLSAVANANCYIVSEAGSYKFKTVKGNGTESVGTVTQAELLWETCNNAEDVAANSVIASVSYADGYITISTPATLKHGNALIAAKDAEGKILWSWHIWIPKTAPAAELYGLSESKKMMDRNIGALDAPAVNSDDAQNAGLFYQWGRKDPLRAVSSIAEGTKAKTYPADVWTESSTQLTAANMHETPCVFIKGSEDWIDVSDKTLWSDAKTVNDPCPLGYKVPKRNETGLFDYLTPDETYLGWAVNNDKNYYTVGKEATSYAVFPFGHYTRSGSYDLKGDGRSWIWTATQKSDTEATQARTIVLNTTTDKLDCSGQKKANGVYVRCVAE